MGHSETHSQLHNLFNNRGFAAIEEQLAPGFMYEDLPRAITVKTAAEFTEYLKGWPAAFSDAEVGSPTYLDGPDFSVARFHGRGHFDGALGDFKGTGRFMDLPMCEVMHYASDGRVLSGELYYDQLTMLGQLGLMSTGADAAAVQSPEAVVRALLRDFDRMDFAALRGRMAEDVRGIDEISRAWIRDQEGMDAYFRGLEGQVTDIATTVFDLSEQIWGETAIVTGWMEQDYKVQGEPVHISSPFTVALRRDGDTWKVALVHAIPLPEEAG
jgi:ketosteroid isomerase-like protein